MAITTIDGALAGMQPGHFFNKVITPTMIVGRPQSPWGLSGIPGSGSFDTTLNGVTLISSTTIPNGALPFYDPGSGNSYLARLVAAISIAGGQLLLCDRLWHNGGYTITSTGVQSSTTPTWPARDDAGATNGKGVLLGLEISAIAGAAAPTITCTYTNSAGVGSRTGGFAFATANSPVSGSFFPIALAAGDVGVQSMQSIQLSTSWLSGTMNMVAYRVLASVNCLAGVGNSIDMLTSGFPQLWNGSVLSLIIIPGTTSGSYVSGHFAVTQG